jgi:RPA family protein
MIQREPAWRVLLEEITSATHEIPPEGERAAGYLLSPLGAWMNRVLVAGALEPGESVGKDPAQPFYRARLTDATTSVFVTAGSYHPKALQVLQQLKEPHTAIVLGKTHLYRGKNEVPYVSLRAENIRFVSREVAAAVTAEAIDGTLERLDAMAHLRGAPSTRSPHEPSSFSPVWTATAQEAVGRTGPSGTRSRARTDDPSAETGGASASVPADTSARGPRGGNGVLQGAAAARRGPELRAPRPDRRARRGRGRWVRRSPRALPASEAPWPLGRSGGGDGQPAGRGRHDRGTDRRKAPAGVTLRASEPR